MVGHSPETSVQILTQVNVTRGQNVKKLRITLFKIVLENRYVN